MELTLRERVQFETEQAEYDQLLASLRQSTDIWDCDGLAIISIGNSGGSANVVHGRPCGGFLLRYAGRTIIVDPGDNSISYLASQGFNPFLITDVLASHAHNDHVGDLSLAISAAINLGLPEKCDCQIIVVPTLVDYSEPTSTKFGFTLPAYAWKAKVKPLYFQDRETTSIDGRVVRSVPRTQINDKIEVIATEARHGHTLVTGFVLNTGLGRIGYTSDTEFFGDAASWYQGLASWYQGCEVLWMNMNTLSLDSAVPTKDAPHDLEHPVHNHLGYVGVCQLIEEVRPKIAIVTHFGEQLYGKREDVQALLRQRFDPLGVTVFCPDNGDSFFFETSLANPPITGNLGT